MALLNVLLFAALLATGFAEIVDVKTCEETNEDVCKINEVRVNPCEGGKTCVFKKGSDASMAFDFTPNFSTNNLKTQVYWANGAIDVEFTEFGSNDACTYTSCPTVAGTAQSLNYNLHVGTKLPKGRYPLKWKLWNEDDPKQVCCFKLTIKLVKEKKK